MVSAGATYPVVSELLKGLYVEVADRDFRLDDKNHTDSRVSLLTGVHRKDVRRLRDSRLTSIETGSTTTSFGAQLVATWLADPRFLDKTGQPRPLARMQTSAHEPSFDDLVAGRTTDIRPRVVLDEWLRLGIVHIDDQERIQLNNEAFVPSKGVDEMLHFFAHNLHDHAAAATANIFGGTAPQLERSVYYDGLTAASIDQLHGRARQLGTKLLKELNQSAMALEAKDATSPEPLQRFTCGIYFHTEAAANTEPPN